MLVVAKSELDSRWVRRNHKSAHTLKSRHALSKADTSEVERLLAQQSSISYRVKQSFLDSISRIQDQIDIDQIAELLKQGRTQEAINTADSALTQAGYRGLASVITQATLAAGIDAAQASPDLTGLDVSFGMTNPQTVAFLSRYEMNLITGLNQDSLASIRQVIQDGVTAGRNPLDIARDIRDYIGLTPRQTQAVLNYRGYLENLDPAALARDLRDARFDSTIQTALDEQSSLEQDYIDKVVGRYQSRMLNYRADTIARTEAMRSVNAGNHLLWNGAVNDGTISADSVVRTWAFTHDSRTRVAHRLVPEMNPDGVGLNEPFDTIDGPLLFPGDPSGPPEATINCRCTVIYRVKPDIGKSVEKFNPNHDELGRFTFGPGLGSADIFVSPNTGNIDFKTAVERIGSSEHNMAVAQIAGVDTGLGLNSHVSSVVGAWSDGAENSTLTTTDSATWEQLRVSAAMKGLATNQKQVLLFQRTEGGGNAFLSSFDAKGNLSDIHDNLLANGLENHTLEPTSVGARVYVYGEDRAALKTVNTVGASYGSHITTSFGKGEFIGTTQQTGTDAEQRASARNIYAGIIRSGGVSKYDARASGRARVYNPDIGAAEN